MGAVSMIVFPETVSRNLVNLLRATDAECHDYCRLACH